jgi:hypothetical protein
MDKSHNQRAPSLFPMTRAIENVF